MNSDAENIEKRAADAKEFIAKKPRTKFATVARKFQVPRSILRRRLEGTGPRSGNHAANSHLNEAEEKGLCRQ